VRTALCIFRLIHTNESFPRKLSNFVSFIAEESLLFSDMTPRESVISSLFFEKDVVTKNWELIIQRPGIISQNNGMLYFLVAAYLFDDNDKNFQNVLDMINYNYVLPLINLNHFYVIVKSTSHITNILLF